MDTEYIFLSAVSVVMRGQGGDGKSTEAHVRRRRLRTRASFPPFPYMEEEFILLGLRRLISNFWSHIVGH